jgi:preprotein translocase subunit SecG
MKDGLNGAVPGTTTNTAATDNTGIAPSEDGGEFLARVRHGKKMKQSTIILAVLFTVGAVCVWFMIKKTTPPPADAAVGTEEAKIENAIAQLTGIRTEMNARMGDIVARFSEFSDVEQIDVADLKKNPFAIELSVGDFEHTLEPGRRKEVEERAQGLQLWSIMASPKNACCMINNKILYKGDKIDGFTVTEIDSRFVELELDEIRVIKKMSE